MKFFSMLFCAGLVFLTSCGEKEKAGEETGLLDLTAELADSKPQIEPGLLRYVPMEVDYLIATRQMDQVAFELMSMLEKADTEKGLLFEKEMLSPDRLLDEAAEEGVEIDDEDLDRSLDLLRAIGNEAFVCGWGKNEEWVSAMAQMLSSVRLITDQLMAQLYVKMVNGDAGGMPDFQSLFAEEGEKWKDAFTQIEIPCVLMGVMPHEDEAAESLLEIWNQAIRDRDESEEVVVTDVEKKVPGGSFSGIRVEWEDESGRALEAVMMVGLVEDGLFFFFGPDLESLELPASASESVLGHSGVELWHEHAEEKVKGMVYISQSIQEAMQSFEDVETSWGVIRNEFERSSLPAAERREVLGILNEIIALEEVQIEEVVEPYAGVLVIDDGFKWESTGGTWSPDDPAYEPWAIPTAAQHEGIFDFHYRFDREAKQKSVKALGKKVEFYLKLVGLFIGEQGAGIAGEDAGQVLEMMAEQEDGWGSAARLLALWRDGFLPMATPERHFVFDLKSDKVSLEAPPELSMMWFAPHEDRAGMKSLMEKLEKEIKDVALMISEDVDLSLLRTEESAEWDEMIISAESGGESLAQLSWSDQFVVLSDAEGLDRLAGVALNGTHDEFTHGWLMRMNFGKLWRSLYDLSKEQMGNEEKFMELELLEQSIGKAHYWIRKDGEKIRRTFAVSGEKK